MEIQTRTKVTYRARSYDQKEKDTAAAMSDLAMFVQDKNQSTHVLSQVSHDARICGIGWHQFDVQNGVILESRVNPRNVIPDMADLTSGMTNQRYAGTGIWMSKALAKQKWPECEDEIDSASNWGMNTAFSGQVFEKSNSVGSYYDTKTQEILVIEWFMRVPSKYYEVVDRSNRLVTTFDKKQAYEMASYKQGTRQPDVTEKDGFKVVIVYFTGNVFLDLLEDAYQLNPATGMLLLTPVVCFRENTTGIPYGLVRNAKGPQSRINKIATRLKWLMAAHQVIMEGDAADENKVRSEAARPDGVLVVKPGKRLDINRHEQAIAQHLASLESADKDLQTTLGIYDESLGIETNANSGVAIQKRQLGSSRNMAMVIDNVIASKRRWAEKLLYLIQSTFTDQVALWVTDDVGEVKLLSLNAPELGPDGKPIKDSNGNPVLKFDIKTGVFDTVVQEVPDVSSQKEVARQMVIDVLPTTGGLQGVTPGLLELLGVPESSKLMEEVTQGLPQQMAAQQAATQAAAKLPTAPGAPTAVPTGGQPSLQPKMGLAA